MRTTAQAWGNSIGVRIPRALAEEIDVREGTRVELRVERSRLLIEAVAVRSYRLTDLLRGVRPSNLHAEVSTGRRAGREVW